MTPKQAIEVMFREWKCIDRNDGIHCDRKCEKCDLVMEVSELRDAFNLAISALQAQETCEDTVSRQAVLRCIKESRENIDWGQSEDGDAFLYYSAALYRTIASKKCLPSTQPEIIHCKDCIWYELPSHKITENCVRWMKSNGILLPIKPDDFCSRAERRTDE